MSAKQMILIVDDDCDNRELLTEALGKAHHETMSATSGEEALEKAQSRGFGLILCDIQMGAVSGLEVLKWFRMHAPDTPVVLLTAFGSIETAIEAMKHGAFDYLLKPINLKELLIVVDRALEHQALVRENLRLKKAFDERIRATAIVAQSRAMVEIFKIIGKASQTKASVLIYGETGTGKELIARALHDNSTRASASFVAINCAGVPDTLLESELFGYVKGAFTNAEQPRRGLLEESSGGTMFLDEISDLSLAGQAKLLRVLQQGEVRRLGSNLTIQVDLRVVAASVRSLEDLVKEGTFREDLLYRLKTIIIEVPALREREDDIPLLAELFLARYGSAKNFQGFTSGAIELLCRYKWPGNIRELEHVIERAVTLAHGPILSEDDLPNEIREFDVTETTGAVHTATVLAGARRKAAVISREQLLGALSESSGNKVHAAEVLGISRWALNRLLQKHGIDGPASSSMA
jgi:two-component system response regulator AtoC